MNKEHILLKLVLDKIGFGGLEEIGDFTKRKILQKKIYLLQLTGLDLGYRYNWYFDEYELNSKTLRKLDKLDEIIALPNALQTEVSEWLELLASLHYLKHIAYWAGKNDPQFKKVFGKLSKSKPHFAEKENLAKAAWKKLKDNGLVEHKTLE